MRIEADFDPLTGLMRRLPAERKLKALLRVKSGNQATHAVALLVDLDHFKEINDTHGHAAGDAVSSKLLSVSRTVYERTIPASPRWG